MCQVWNKFVEYCNLLTADVMLEGSFLNFVSCKNGTTREAISHYILITLHKWVLLRGQAYDGAGGLAGCVKSVAATNKSRCPLALYINCFSHRLRYLQ